MTILLVADRQQSDNNKSLSATRKSPVAAQLAVTAVRYGKFCFLQPLDKKR